MPAGVLQEVARAADEANLDTDGAISLEGRLCLVLDGSAEMLAAGEAERSSARLLSAGDVCGSLTTLASPGMAGASLRALTPVRLVWIDGADLERSLEGRDDFRPLLTAVLDEIAIVSFLRTVAGPFRTLDVESSRRLSSVLQRTAVARGQAVFRQGEPGDRCFLVLSGRVEVVAEAGSGAERRLASLGPGAVFGEVALLTDEPRNATVLAGEDSEFLVLHRDDLAGFLDKDRQLRRAFIDMLEWRSRPRRAEGVIEQGITAASGEFAIILKRPARHSFFRLSELGWFIWQRIDGQRQLRDLTMEALDAFKTFSPAAIQELLRGLAASGFVEGVEVRLPAAAGAPTGAWSLVASLPRRITQWELSVPNVDPVITTLYEALARRFMTRAALIASTLFIAAGLSAFLLSAGDAADAVDHVGHVVLLLLIPGQFLAVLVHESAHAFAVKRYGREIPRVGLGWYWFGPVAFVDTSDMWLAPARPRIFTSLAGPFGDLLTGAVFGLIAALGFSPLVTAAGWQLAFSCFIVCLLNFNPLLEYDGYYALADLLDRPNLRHEALSWLGKTLRGPSRERLQGHRVDALFALASCVFVGVMASITVVAYRLFLEGLMAGFLPSGAASALAFVFAAVVSLSAGFRLFEEVFAEAA